MKWATQNYATPLKQMYIITKSNDSWSNITSKVLHDWSPQKKIYTKLDNINPRLSNYVNNGWFANNTLGGRITQQGTLIGIVTDVVNDKGLLKNSGGAIYKWIKVKPSAEAIKQIKDDCTL